MSKIKFSILLSFILLMNVQITYAQGCSDAGVCSATQHFNKTDEGKSSNQFTFNQSFGLGDQGSKVITSVFNYSFQINERISIGASLPYSVTDGNLATTHGIGDFVLNTSFRILKKDEQQLNLFLAGKIASGNANKKIEGNALPMVYQQSSGTNDIIVALNWLSNDWLIAAAYQHAFNSNENEFKRSDFDGNTKAYNYHSSAYLNRGDDLMLRIQKIFRLKNKSYLKAGILPIYRLQEDEVKLGSDYREISNSDGLTVNLYLGWNHKLGEKWMGELLLAAPPLTREVRADGTTRSFLISYIIKFGQ